MEHSEIITKLKNGNTIEFPLSLERYNSNKGGVDVMNRMISNLRNLHAVNKWWKSIFAEILDISIINSFIIAKYYFPKISHKEFRLEIVKFLKGKYVRKTRGRPSGAYGPYNRNK